MSEKFGLNWKEYDYERMALLITAITETNKFQEEKAKNGNKPAQPKFRPRVR